MATKKNKCTHCKDRFPVEDMVKTPVGKFCTLAHALEYAQNDRGKQRIQQAKKAANDIKDEVKANRAAVREFRNNDKSHQTKLTQDVFNTWVRTVRDEFEGCISCDTEDFEGGYGGAWDCGHFLSRGSAPELRFISLNAYKQCKKCNGGSGKYARKNHTVAKEYERRLIIKIGQDKVDWLRGPHEPAKYTCQQLREIRAFYAKLTRDKNKDDSDCPHVVRYQHE